MTPESSGLAMIFLDNNLYCPTLAILNTTLAILNPTLAILNPTLAILNTTLAMKKKLSGNLQQRETRDNDSDQNSWMRKREKRKKEKRGGEKGESPGRTLPLPQPSDSQVTKKSKKIKLQSPLLGIHPPNSTSHCLSTCICLQLLLALGTGPLLV